MVNYVVGYEIKLRDVVKTVRYAIMDFVACALRGGSDSGCVKLFGLCVLGIECKYGVYVLGMEYYFDFVMVMFNVMMCVWWLDYNDSFYGAEWAYSSDTIGVILSVSEYVS